MDPSWIKEGAVVINVVRMPSCDAECELAVMAVVA